jgi:hypothetical protein
MARLRLVQPPAPLVLELVVVATQRPGVDLGGEPAAAVIHGVVQIGAGGRAATAGVDTDPIPDLDMAT